MEMNLMFIDLGKGKRSKVYSTSHYHYARKYLWFCHAVDKLMNQKFFINGCSLEDFFAVGISAKGQARFVLELIKKDSERGRELCKQALAQTC